MDNRDKLEVAAQSVTQDLICLERIAAEKWKLQMELNRSLVEQANALEKLIKELDTRIAHLECK